MLRKEIGLNIRKDSISAALVASIVFLASLHVTALNTQGDQFFYDRVYDVIPYLRLDEAFVFYQMTVSSREPVHFSMVYFLGEYLSKELFVSLLNFALAFVSYKVLKSLGANWVIAILIVLTNYYLWVLYAPAERLKVACIFIFAAWLILDNRTKFALLAGLSVLSHASMVIILLSGALVYFRSELVKFATELRLSRAVFIVAPLFLASVLLSAGQLTTKAAAYFQGTGYMSLEEALRMLAFFLLSLLYAKDRKNVVIVFFVLMSMVFLFGGDRVNMFGYLAFLFFSVHYRQGFNVGVLATSLYFMTSTVGLLNNIILTGNAYYHLAK
jgi:multisubunit Na+/H+ antiporter MnhC subunit